MSNICSLAVELTLSPTGFAVGANERSICIFRQLAYLRLTFDEYTHFPSSETVSDRVCRWRDAVFYMQLDAAS